MSAIRVNGQWKTPSIVYAKVEGQWKIVGQSYSKVDGLWRQTTFAGPPARPIMVWHATGQFRISNFTSSLNYQTRFASGSGSATLNTSTGIYTLDGANSGFFVSAAYAQGAPISTEGYMERKSRQSNCGNFSECGAAPTYPCNCQENRNATCNEPPGSGGVCPNPGLPGASCGCYDASQNRCICWVYGPPSPCQTCGGGFNYCCLDISFLSQGYTDRTTEWSKQL